MVNIKEHPASDTGGRRLKQSRPVNVAPALHYGTTTGHGALRDVTHLLRSSTVRSGGERFTISSARTSGRVLML